LVAWLFARSQSARFRLRVDDLDPQRSKRQHELGQIADLRALGIDWDGPVVRQSERIGRYEEAIAQLESDGWLYPCFCSRAEIRDAASAPHGESSGSASPPRGELPEGAYPGTCAGLSRSQALERISAGHQFALRLRAGGQRIEFTDRLLGPQAGVVDDFVIRRADGVPAYQLAVVLDDAGQAIGEVVRGDDLADSTPRQILLARLLGLPVPRYAHVPLVLGADGVRLAKRHRAPTLADRDEPPAATLALLAHTLGLAADRELVASPSELLAEFDPARIPREPVVLQ
jgi:glutamyl-tRNA synthetase